MNKKVQASKVCLGNKEMTTKVKISLFILDQGLISIATATE